LGEDKEESEAVVAAGKCDELTAEMVKQHLTVYEGKRQHGGW
jgi:hypothetical protein